MWWDSIAFLMIIVHWIGQWKNFKNLLTFGEDMDNKKVPRFWPTLFTFSYLTKTFHFFAVSKQNHRNTIKSRQYYKLVNIDSQIGKSLIQEGEFRNTNTLLVCCCCFFAETNILKLRQFPARTFFFSAKPKAVLSPPQSTSFSLSQYTVYLLAR